MSFLPYPAIWLLLVVSGALALPVKRSKAAFVAAPACVFLAICLWLAAGWAASPGPAQATFAGATWNVDAISRQLTGIVLWLCLIAVIDSGARGYPRTEAGTSRLQTSLGAWLAAATLPALWAGDPQARVAALAFFIVTWVLLRRELYGETTAELMRAATRLIAALFLIWFSLTTAGVAGTAAALMAVYLLAGAWPLHGRSAPFVEQSPGIASMLYALPLVIGASTLALLRNQDAISLAQTAAITVLALLGLFASLLSALRDGANVASLLRAMKWTVAGLFLLAGVWLAPEAFLPAVRLAVFLPLLLWFFRSGNEAGKLTSTDDSEAIVTDALGRRYWLDGRTLSLVVVFPVLAGLPITVGFSTLAALYQAWAIPNGLLLTATLSVLMGCWLGMIVWALRGLRATLSHASLRPLGWLLLVLPIAGLMQIDVSLLSSAALSVWIALLLSLLIGLLSGRLLIRRQDWTTVAQEAISMQLPFSGAGLLVRNFASAVSNAVADASDVLEGDLGLLWVLGFIILVLALV